MLRRLVGAERERKAPVLARRQRAAVAERDAVVLAVERELDRLEVALGRRRCAAFGGVAGIKGEQRQLGRERRLAGPAGPGGVGPGVVEAAAGPDQQGG